MAKGRGDWLPGTFVDCDGFECSISSRTWALGMAFREVKPHCLTTLQKWIFYGDARPTETRRGPTQVLASSEEQTNTAKFLTR